MGTKPAISGFLVLCSVAAFCQGTGRTVAGDGTPGSGPGQLRLPTGVAIDAEDNVYVADTYNHRVQRLSRDGTLTTVAGSEGEGQGTNQLFFPRAVAVDRDGNLFVADSYNHRVQKITRAGVVSTIAGQGGQGSGSTQLSYPRGLAVDGAGAVYIADTYNHRVQKVTPAGAVTSIAGQGGNGNAAGQLQYPHGVAVDGSGNVYVADMWNQRVQKVSPEGIVITVLGGEAGSGSGQLQNPGGVAVDTAGGLYVIDTNNDRVRMLRRDGRVVTVAGNGGQGAGETQLFSPYAAAVDSRGNLYIADTNNHRVQRVDDVVLPAEPELRSAATNQPAPGAPNLLLRYSHPVECAGPVTVVVGGYQVEWKREASGRVRFAVPEGVDPEQATEVYLLCGGQSVSPAVRLPMAAASPGLFVDGEAVANDMKAPAKAGEPAVLRATGLGVLGPPDATGLRWTVNPVSVTVGGQEAAVLYAGSAPGQEAGVAQVNILVPAGLGAGRQPIQITEAGVTASGPAFLVVQ